MIQIRQSMPVFFCVDLKTTDFMHPLKIKTPGDSNILSSNDEEELVIVRRNNPAAFETH